MVVLQGFELLPCDGVVASHSPYRLIVATLVVVALIGGVGKSVRCRCQFPTLLLRHKGLNKHIIIRILIVLERSINE